ncbi:High-affinity nickel transport protein [Granulibacter bethesdensis CGDNIH4]|nr:High-affinity nickel transport protein [Granulibacter bethesdensis CGDNIH4]
MTKMVAGSLHDPMPPFFLYLRTIPRSILLLHTALIAVNGLVWLIAWQAFATRPVLLGTAFLAWIFGLRHALDADHIAAIDNTVRRLMQAGIQPHRTGLWFSLGHSTIVVLACALIAVSAQQFQTLLENIRFFGGTVGTLTSAVFLLCIAVANLMILRTLWQQFRNACQQTMSQAALHDALDKSGLLSRLCRPVFERISQPWHLYPLGVLFGLGFDTATEIGLLGITATQHAGGIPAWEIMIFPALFTTGMTLVDTLDSSLMAGAYGWAFSNPQRKLWYNITMTAISITVALLIGSVEALGLIGAHLHLRGTIWQDIASLNDDLADFGFLIVGVFIVIWLLSALAYRLADLDNCAHRQERSPGN